MVSQVDSAASVRHDRPARTLNATKNGPAGPLIDQA